MSELFLKIVNMSISASWLVLAVLVLRLILKKAPKWANVLLWGIVAIRLVCPFSIESALSLIPSSETISPEIMLDPNPQISTGVVIVDDVINPMIMYSARPNPATSANPLQILIPVAAQIWMLGIVLLLAYTLISYWRLRRKVATAVRLRDDIFQSEYVASPFVLGLFRPRIYLPYAMSDVDIRHVLAHEQAHILRRDHWWKPLGFLLLTLHWFNPLMWLAYILLCRDIELACDEKVIEKLGNEERADYSQALLSCSVNRRTIAACPLAFGEVGVKARVRSVMNYRKPAFWVVLGALILCVVAAVCFLTNPESRNEHVGVTYYYGTVTDQAMSVVNEGGRESREYICLRCDDGEELLFWAAESGTSAPSLLGQHVMVRARVEESSGLLVMTKITITEHTWAGNREEAIENAILDFNWSPQYEGMLQCADFVLLSNESGGPADGDTIDTEIFYGIALHQVYKQENGELVEESGSHVPTVLTFAISEEGKYILKEYWQPRDGGYYADDIREKFPLFVWPDTQKYIKQQHENNYAKAQNHFGLKPSEETLPAATEPGTLEVSDFAYFLELAMPDRSFRDMSPERRYEILREYGDLLEGYPLLAQESEDGSMFYITGYFGGGTEDSPLAGMLTHTSDTDSGMVQLLYREKDREEVESALASQEQPEAGYIIRNSFLHYSLESGLFLIHPMDTGWGLSDVLNRYQSPKGRAYMLDAAARGIALATPEGPYLEVYLISEKWGEIYEKIPLIEEEAARILAEDRQKLEEGYGFAARLYPGPDSAMNFEMDAGWFTEFLGVPQTVLDLAVEKCGYKFTRPGDIQGAIVEARLDCNWLDAPVYVEEGDLERLQSILSNVKFGYVGACGYGAKLTIQLSDGSSMVLFKGTDGCDSMVFGSYGGYFIGDEENLEFWELFGLDPDTKELIG